MVVCDEPGKSYRYSRRLTMRHAETRYSRSQRLWHVTEHMADGGSRRRRAERRPECYPSLRRVTARRMNHVRRGSVCEKKPRLRARPPTIAQLKSKRRYQDRCTARFDHARERRCYWMEATTAARTFAP